MSTSSHMLRKLGLLAAVGTAAAAMPWQGALSADNPPAAAATEAVDDLRSSQWGTAMPEVVLRGVAAAATSPMAGPGVSPYRSGPDSATGSNATEPAVAPPAETAPAAAGANQAVDLSSAYRPAGSAAGGANRAATVGGVPREEQQTESPQPASNTPPAKTDSPAVDIASDFQPVVSGAPSILLNATAEADEPANGNKSTEPAAPAKPDAKPAATAAPSDVAENESNKTAKPATAEATPAKESNGESSANDIADRLQAMFRDGDRAEHANAKASDPARLVKHCSTMLGIGKSPTCVEGKCYEPLTYKPKESLAKDAKSQQPAYRSTNAPALVKAPPTIRDEAVSPAAHLPQPERLEDRPQVIQVVQGQGGRGNPFADDPVQPGQLPAGHFEVIEEENRALEVRVRRSLLLRTPFDIYRTAVVDSSVCDVVQFTPREVSIVGKATGSTNVTFWFEDGNHRPVTYVVRVIPDLEEKSQAEVQYRLLEDVLAELFPDSKVRLVLVADKLIVKGQAASAEEAANIMAIVRGQSSSNITNNRSFVSPAQGFATNVFNEAETGRGNQPRVQVINMLMVPGVQQVALRVKIAQLNRSAARGIGLDAEARISFGSDDSALFVESMLNMAAGNSPSVITQFDDANINLGLRYLQQQGVVRLLSEPTLVTLSGRPATFVSGGEFAVPTVVGSAGVNAVTTDFRAFGVIVSFVPTVLGKDRIRLNVSPEFSQINENLNNGGTFGLNTNAVTTTVEMREGQTLAIAGLLEDTMKNTRVGNVPYLERIFGTRDTSRNENELIILVTPELVHPMEPEEVPPLPGFDVTEPTNKEFYWHGHLEGHPTSGFRSAVWPELRRRYSAGGPAMTSGDFGHGQ